jgi:hypothetical protein
MLEEMEKAGEIQSIERLSSQRKRMEQPLLGKISTLTEKKKNVCGQKLHAQN